LREKSPNVPVKPTLDLAIKPSPGLVQLFFNTPNAVGRESFDLCNIVSPSHKPRKLLTVKGAMIHAARVGSDRPLWRMSELHCFFDCLAHRFRSGMKESPPCSACPRATQRGRTNPAPFLTQRSSANADVSRSFRPRRNTTAHQPTKPMKSITQIPGSGRPIGVLSGPGGNSGLGWIIYPPASLGV